MLKTYLIIAYRNFIRNKVFSLINVLGLAIGISASLVIFLIVHHDFNFDKFEKDRPHLYRIVTDMVFFGSPIHNSGVPSPLPDAVRKEVSGVDEVIGFHRYNGDPKVTIIKKTNETAFTINHQRGIILADNNYFSLIPHKWLAGSEKTALNEPYQVVLTASRAKIYFPAIPISGMIGRQVVYDDSLTATVSGIVADIPDNTDFIFKEFISQSTITAPGLKLKGHYSWDGWGSINGGSQLLVRLAQNTSPSNIESQLLSLEKKYDRENNNPGSTRNFRLQPFDDIHFNSKYDPFGGIAAQKPVLYGLLAVAAFLLSLACINFINLSTAQSVERAKEIGVRKTLGSSGNQLIFQFLTETFFVTCISLLLSLLLVPMILKLFADFIPADLHFDFMHQPYMVGFAALLVLSVSLLAGFYPALVLSRFKPVQVLKNQGLNGHPGSRRALLRKSLTISQFLIAQVFTMATFIAVKQINFILTKDMGFKKEAIINVETPFLFNRSGKADTKRFILLNEIKQLPGVQIASLGGDAPASDGWSSNDLTFKDGKKNIETDVRQKYGDTNYLKLYHIKILAGRAVRQSDTANEYVINETYMHILGVQKPDDIINKDISNIRVVGVMADFNQESLHASVKPLAFSSEMGNSWIIHIALKSGEAESAGWKSTIASVENAFRHLYPREDFSYTFLDEDIAKFYKSEQNLSQLLKWATGLAIFISCMGLLGLTIYTTNQRTKEIGVRKVLGASISQIVTILSKDFVQLVLVASLIAIPLAWWAMNKWLQNFAYKTTVSWWVFAVSVLFMILIALLTLIIQTFRAASANPVDSLRAE
jgi:putative ABC transport system permease protein